MKIMINNNLESNNNNNNNSYYGDCSEWREYDHKYNLKLVLVIIC